MRDAIRSLATDNVRFRDREAAVTAHRIVARNFLTLGSGEVVARVVAFLATIYVARTLGSTAFGIVGLAAAVMLYLGRLVDGGLEQGLGVQLVAEKRSRIQTLTATLLTTRLAIAAVIGGLLVALAAFVLPAPEGPILATFGLILFPLALSTRWIHLGLERARPVAAARTAGELLMAGLVLLTVHGPGDLKNVPIAQFAGDTLAAVILIGILLRSGYRVPLRCDWPAVRELLPRAWPLVAGTLLSLLIYNSDLILLRLFRDASTVGLYVAAYFLVSFLGNLSTAYGMSLLPTLTRLAPRADEERALYHTAISQAFAVAAPVTVGGCLLAPAIIATVFGDAYRASALPLAVLLWIVTLGIFRDIAMAGLVARGREDRVLRMNIWGTTLNVLVNLAAIPLFGMLGAAATTVVTEICRAWLALTYARRAGLAPVAWNRLWRPSVAVVAMTVVLVELGSRPVWVSIPAGAATYFVMLTAVGGLRWRRSELPVLKV